MLKERARKGMAEKNFKAVIFDMDGVIFDSERMVIACWKELAEKYQIANIEEACRSCLGVTMRRTREIMLERYGADFPYDQYAAEASRMFHSRFDGGRLPQKKGIKELLEALKQSEKKIALASSTRRQTVEQELRDGGLIEYFDALVCGDMVEKSKPEPDIYLKACSLVGVDPTDAYAIEDSYNGILSASAGGLRPIMVPDLASPTPLMEEKAEIILSDLLAVKEYLFYS